MNQTERLKRIELDTPIEASKLVFQWVKSGCITVAEFRELLPLVELQSYLLCWRDGTTEEIQGTSIANAFARAGYGAGAMAALNSFESIA